MGTFERFIKKYHLVVDSSTSSDKILCLRSKIRTEEEAQSFINKFGQKTSTIWRVHNKNYNPQRVVFRKAWVCRNVRSPGTEKNNCPAKLDIFVKKINSFTVKNDKFLLKKPRLPCIIRMHFKHNHNCQDNFEYIKVPDEIKELFEGYFDNGYGVTKALRLYHEHLKNIKTTATAHFIPTKRQASYLYRMWYEHRSLTSIPCDDVISNEPWNSFEWDELIGAIPHENSPPKKVKKIALNFPTIPRNKNLLDDRSEKVELVTTTNADGIMERHNPVTIMSTSNSISSKNSVLPILYLDRPVQTQHIANSSNHLNGSVLTVMNSNSFFTLISPCLISSPISSTLTPVSSTANIEAISSKPTKHLKLLPKKTPPGNESSTKQTLETPPYISKNAKSNFLYQSKAMDLSNAKFPLNFVPKNSNCDVNIQDSVGQSKNNSLLSISNRPVTAINQICQQALKDTEINSTPLMNGNSVSGLDEIVVPDKSNLSNFQISSASSVNSKVSYIQTPSANTLLSMNSECSESLDGTNTQIHITNTIHQSGAQVCMKSPVQANQDPIVNAVHVSELLGYKQSSNELVEIKIKEEPPDLLPIQESENSNFSPVIFKVSSVNDGALRSNGAIPLQSIKKEKVENETTEDESVHLSSNAGNENRVLEEEDEDQLFLVSLLQELKQLPTNIRDKLKSDIQNLVSSAKVLQNRKKRRL